MDTAGEDLYKSPYYITSLYIYEMVFATDHFTTTQITES